MQRLSICKLTNHVQYATKSRPIRCKIMSNMPQNHVQYATKSCPIRRKIMSNTPQNHCKIGKYRFNKFINVVRDCRPAALFPALVCFPTRWGIRNACTSTNTALMMMHTTYRVTCLLLSCGGYHAYLDRPIEGSLTPSCFLMALISFCPYVLWSYRQHSHASHLILNDKAIRRIPTGQ